MTSLPSPKNRQDHHQKKNAEETLCIFHIPTEPLRKNSLNIKSCNNDAKDSRQGEAEKDKLFSRGFQKK
ncbi:MAG: hypothetical protein A2512_06775 [Deltaproteobacteria bacterium RIFOXYD12_FULL_56_24]|nr:MAG: hypothetical protein A2512_06775 [Deltaproteobacteria bacterium RIFOXYD12_FULL_56_24]